MLSKKDRPFFFTDQQMEQLKRTNGTLRQLNRDVRRELRGIEAHLTDKQYREAGLLLGKLAIRMISVLRLREDVLNSGREQGPTKFQLVISVDCNDCVIEGRDRPLSRSSSDKIPEIDSAHLAELDSVMETAQNVVEQVWLCFEPRTPPSAFLVGLKRLTDVLLKQRRHFQDIAAKPPCITEVIQEFEFCSSCHKPIKYPIQNEDPNAPVL